MSHLGDVVWVSQDPLCDPMYEFGGEGADEDPTRPIARESLFQRVAAVSRIAMPQEPPLEAPAPRAVSVPEPENEPASAPASALSPVLASEPLPVPASPAAQRGRWFVGVAILGLLALGQAPFVVLWALQSIDPPSPIAIQVTKPPVAFTIATPLPVERTLVPPRPAPAPPAPRPAPAGSLSGWLRVEVPVPMRITEDGRLLEIGRASCRERV